MRIRKWINWVYTLRKISFINKDLEYLVSKMENGCPFSFSRFGDGEWSAILGRKGENCDGHKYFPELGERLRKAINSPLGYMYALQPNAIRNLGKEIVAYLRKNNINIFWYNSNIFHDANRQGRLFPLIKQLQKIDVVLIGPEHLRQLDKKVFKYKHFIEVPSKNCFLKVNIIKEKILSYRTSQKNILYAFSSSMATNVLIHELFPIIGADNWLIDFGSVWDIYTDVKSRGVYSEFDWSPIIKKNLGRVS